MVYSVSFYNECDARGRLACSNSLSFALYTRIDIIYLQLCESEGSLLQLGSGELLVITTEAAKMAQKHRNGTKPLVTAAERGNVVAVDALLTSGYEGIEERADDGSTALIRAASNGHESIVKSLLAAGAINDAQSNVRVKGNLFLMVHSLTNL